MSVNVLKGWVLSRSNGELCSHCPHFLFRLSILEEAEDYPQIMQGQANISPTITLDRIEMANSSAQSQPGASRLDARKAQVNIICSTAHNSCEHTPRRFLDIGHDTYGA